MSSCLVTLLCCVALPLVAIVHIMLILVIEKKRVKNKIKLTSDGDDGDFPERSLD